MQFCQVLELRQKILSKRVFSVSLQVCKMAGSSWYPEGYGLLLSLLALLENEPGLSLMINATEMVTVMYVCVM